jgi:PAS domain S-box-containing protein
MNIQKENNFAGRIESVHDRSQVLYSNARRIPWQQSRLVINCLEELRVALAELHDAEEKLRAQNDALLAAQHVIEAERQRYRALFEFAPDSYFITDLQGTVQEANQAAAALLQVDRADLIGKPLVSFVPPDQRCSFRIMLNHLPAINRVQEWEISLRQQGCQQGQGNQQALKVALTVETGRDQQGEPTVLRWLLRDITARKQAESQMQQVQLQNLELAETERLKKQFIATISHELRTPLNAILGFSNLMLRQFHHHHDLQLSSMAERIFRNGHQLLLIIEEMLDFSNLKAARMELHPTSFDLNELAATTLAELRPLAACKALELEFRPAQPSLAVVHDPVRLRQVLINLLSNAIKFTDTGSITLTLERLTPDRISLTVHDTGIGIGLADQPHIFEEFRQVNQSTTRQHQGTGLGLAIVHQLVQLMNGSISVISQPGEGSRFRVELPSELEH